jgi:hypothetical protein
MTRRSQQQNPEEIRLALISLLKDFDEKLKQPDLRKKVIALVPAYHLLRDLGSSLIETSGAARERIIQYLCKYPQIVIQGDELMVVSGIGEWARRVRELRVEHGWSIISGVTAKEMVQDGELKYSDFGVSNIKPDEYILLSATHDRDAAYRWNVANEIRKSNLAVRDKLLQYFKSNLRKPITGEELRYVAKDKTEWARRVRELRTEFGWPIVTRNTGRPDLPIGVYVLEEDRQAPPHDRKIPDPVRCEVLERDQHRCQKCGWEIEKRKAGDPRSFLELHHKHHHASGGQNTKENLIVFCNVCHDDIHRRDISIEDFLRENAN